MTAAVATTCGPLATDANLTQAILNAVNNALTMCEMNAKCVGVSSIPLSNSGEITGMIGVHGKVSGFVMVNTSRYAAIHAVAGLLQESFSAVTSQVLDGMGEITNIIVGGIKSSLARTDWGFQQITVPSVIVGNGYQIAYGRGLEFVNVTFEVNDPEAVMLDDRLLNVSMSLLRL